VKDNKIVSLHVSGLSYGATLRRIIQLAKSKKPSYCCFANVHMTIEAYDDASFAQAVNAADLVCADGMPLVTATRLLYKKEIERVAGMDMMPTAMEAAAKEGISVFFYGASRKVLDKMEERARKELPQLQIAGSFAPPFKQFSEQEKKEHLQLINDSGAGIVMVALGCPKQERWMAENSKHINAVLLGVGAAFSVYANMRKRAPEWIRNLSLEWLFRLFQDPLRLFKRYCYTNSKFIALFLKQYLGKKTG
jgi:N-acetylglucosaminyldiphosphoundecaprenol N-acetyl-beta-D-mannosaminyltransferase